MSAIGDALSPSTYGEDRIDLTLSPETPTPIALSPVIILVAYDRADPEGICLPLELTITGPSGRGTFQRRFFRRVKPLEISFRPTEGGPTLIRLAELFHNRYIGRLVLDIAGNPLDRL
jgi:hypothetical protein